MNENLNNLLVYKSYSPNLISNYYSSSRLINQSLYQEMLLLQKFNDIGGKILKPKKIQPPTSKKN